jgi:hypothetical protein
MESLDWRQRRGSSPAARRGARQRAGLTPVSASNTLSCERETPHPKPTQKTPLTVITVSTAANTPAGQPGLLRPSKTRFVTSPRIGYANRPTTGNWRYGDLHPARLRPCRLLLSTIPPIIPYGGFSPVRLEGWLSSGAFPDDRQLKPAPGIRRPMSGLHPPFVHLVVTSVVPRSVGPQTRSCTAMRWLVHLPQGPSLGTGL